MKVGKLASKHVRASVLLLLVPVALAAAFVAASVPVRAQQTQSKYPAFAERDINRGLEILKIVRDNLEEHYYDKKFHGMDLKARFKMAEERIRNAKSNGEINSIIAQVLVELNDSHTFFIPPQRVGEIDYGWEMQMIGDKCYVVDVKPGSNAEAEGLKVGDEVWSIDGFEPTRDNIWKIDYSYNVLKPRPGMRLVLQDPNGRQREMVVMAKTSMNTEGFIQRLLDRAERSAQRAFRFREVGGDLLIWKMPGFLVEEKEIDDAMKKAQNFKSLVIDMRGNPGGYEKAMLRLLGYFFDHDVKLGEIQRRKDTVRLVAKTRGGENVFKGSLVVLIDSRSASAAELFARVIQLEKRGTVIGDRSAGAVMRGRIYNEAVVHGTFDTFSFVPFALSITDADIRMNDGQSLEHTGVVPDELLLPTRDDLATRRDPVLARAAAVVGLHIEPQEAGSFFPLIRVSEEEFRTRLSKDLKSGDEKEKKDRDGKKEKNGKDAKQKEQPKEN